MTSESGRKSALKHERSQNELLSSPLKAPGLKAARVGEEGYKDENADVSMDGRPVVAPVPKLTAGVGVLDETEGVHSQSSGRGCSGPSVTGGSAAVAISAGADG